ncbi:TIGR04282 family arsenosugar biosynthesis glycosyltransferase [Rhodopila sp.]|uniref:TIGR04282 family arsenosugar biosynthesis glycosyltransferase n=1 Tax=Rhodopila sp. TaxID=2480087 RepID=UPI003D0CFE9E
MRDTVIVFAKVPRLGMVKRRLAAGIGDRAALRFHAATLTALLRDLQSCRSFDVVLAGTPDRMRLRLPVRVDRIDQGRGDLGVRMTRALRRYRRGRVALTGCDIPDAGSADARAAFRVLGTTDAVFGPAADGGYWLIALGPRRPAELFGNARWSTRHALADTLTRFRRHRVGFVRTLADVDTAADWRCWRAGVRHAGRARPW